MALAAVAALPRQTGRLLRLPDIGGSPALFGLALVLFGAGAVLSAAEIILGAADLLREDYPGVS